VYKTTSPMQIPLSTFEIEILNKVIYTQTFSEYQRLTDALRRLVDEQKSNIVSAGSVPEHDFPLFQKTTVNNILQFLVRNGFFAVREGEVYYITERGKSLQQQRTIQSFVEWEEKREDKAIADLHTIEQQGYLEEDQTFKHERAAHMPLTPVEPEPERRKYFGYYLLIVVVIIVLAAIGKSHKWW